MKHHERMLEEFKRQVRGIRARLDELEKDGIAQVAAQEIASARAWLEEARRKSEEGSALAVGYEKLVGLDVTLMREMLETVSRQGEAATVETRVGEARDARDAEKAAYEYLVDQILASGLVSQWAMP